MRIIAIRARQKCHGHAQIWQQGICLPIFFITSYSIELSSRVYGIWRKWARPFSSADRIEMPFDSHPCLNSQALTTFSDVWIFTWSYDAQYFEKNVLIIRNTCFIIHIQISMFTFPSQTTLVAYYSAILQHEWKIIRIEYWYTYANVRSEPCNLSLLPFPISTRCVRFRMVAWRLNSQSYVNAIEPWYHSKPFS